MAHVRLFAGAADAAGVESCDVPATTTAELVAALTSTYGAKLGAVLPRCSMLVDGVATVGDTPIANDASIDVLPPFAGG